MAKTKSKQNIYALAECAVMLALTVALKYFTPIKLPFGGSVTICSLVPICLVSYRHGLSWGFGTGFAFAVISLLMGLDNYAYIAHNFGTVLIFILFDYLFACMALGLGGIFRKTIKKQIIALPLGVFVATAARYICYVVSGATIWRDVVENPTFNTAALWYSVTYNAGYMIPEIIISVVGAVLLCGIFNFKKKNLI